jgi:hypothetical protein
MLLIDSFALSHSILAETYKHILISLMQVMTKRPQCIGDRLLKIDNGQNLKD